MGDQREGPEGYHGFQEKRATVVHWRTCCKRYKLSRNREERMRTEQLIVGDRFPQFDTRSSTGLQREYCARSVRVTASIMKTY